MEPKTSWNHLLKSINVEDFHLHDLRRTFGSYQAASGSNSFIIGKSLGHKAGSKATAVYARLDLDPIRKSVQNSVDLMCSFVGDNIDDIL